MVGPFLLAVEKSKSKLKAKHTSRDTPSEQNLTPDCSQQAGFLRLVHFVLRSRIKECGARDRASETGGGFMTSVLYCGLPMLVCFAR